jgi:hypothetical protein
VQEHDEALPAYLPPYAENQDTLPGYDAIHQPSNEHSTPTQESAATTSVPTQARVEDLAYMAAEAAPPYASSESAVTDQEQHQETDV